MKVLIMFITAIGASIFASIIGKALIKLGLVIGYVPAIIIWFVFFISFIILSKKWDKKQEIKKRNKLTAKANAEGLTVTQYLFKDVPEDCVKSCAFYINNCQYEEFKTYLSTCYEDGKISKESYKLLMNEYYKK